MGIILSWPTIFANVRAIVPIWLTISANVSANARELYPGQYAQAPPDQRRWFNEQISPKTGDGCCSQADGEFVQEDIRIGRDGTSHYFASGKFSEGEWIEVPNDVILPVPNWHGKPVVWWVFDADIGVLEIRCYSPGAGL
jgi:hypothetical protein